MAQKILGTWQSVDDPNGEIVGESTYTSDGEVGGFTTSTQVLSDGSIKIKKIRMRAHWLITGNILILDQIDSDPPGLFPFASSQRYKIESISQSTLVFIDQTSGEKLRRQRKPGG